MIISTRYISVEEIVNELGCNKNYVYDLAETGYIRSHRRGTRVIITRAAYEAFLDYADEHDLPGYEELRIKAQAIRAERRVERSLAA